MCEMDLPKMKTAYRNAVVKRFHALFSAQFPQFVLRRGRDRDMPGSRLYCRTVSDRLFLFVYLIVHDDADDFNVDVGHGPSEAPTIESFFVKPPEMLALPSSLFRLAEFWDDRDPWWVVEPFRPGWTEDVPVPEEEYLPRVEALVAEVVARLAEHGRPYFDQAIVRHGGPEAPTAA